MNYCEIHATPSEGSYVRVRDLKRLLESAEADGFTDNARIIGPVPTAFGTNRITLQETAGDMRPASYPVPPPPELRQ